MLRKITTFIVLALLCNWQLQAKQNKAARYALVIGNSNYELAPLNNPINDANLLARKLNELDFEVTLVLDANRLQLDKQVSQYYAHIANTDNESVLALVYYAGHALQINHNNYLVPLGLQFAHLESFAKQLFSVNSLFEKMALLKNAQNIVILDACRNNPFGDVEELSILSDGLAPVKAPKNTYIAYATAPGGVAADGAGKNGIYTKHLAKHIEGNITVEEAFRKIRLGVSRETKNRQIPWEHSSLLTEVYFNPPKNKKVPDLVIF